MKLRHGVDVYAPHVPDTDRAPEVAHRLFLDRSTPSMVLELLSLVWEKELSNVSASGESL